MRKKIKTRGKYTSVNRWGAPLTPPTYGARIRRFIESNSDFKVVVNYAVSRLQT